MIKAFVVVLVVDKHDVINFDYLNHSSYMIKANQASLLVPSKYSLCKSCQCQNRYPLTPHSIVLHLSFLIVIKTLA